MLPKRLAALTCALVLVLPAEAFAVTDGLSAAVSTVTGIGSLLITAMLLIVVVQLRRVADGSAIVENIAFAVAASLCLGTAILLSWLSRFTSAESIDVVRAGADVLAMLAMLLYAAYFVRVKRALAGFLACLTADETLVAAQGTAPAEDDVA